MAWVAVGAAAGAAALEGFRVVFHWNTYMLYPLPSIGGGCGCWSRGARYLARYCGTGFPPVALTFLQWRPRVRAVIVINIAKIVVRAAVRVGFTHESPQAIPVGVFLGSSIQVQSGAVIHTPGNTAYPSRQLRCDDDTERDTSQRRRLCFARLHGVMRRAYPASERPAVVAALR